MIYFLPRLDVTGNRPIWLVAILPATLIAFMKMIWVRMEGVIMGRFRYGTFLVDLTFFRF